MRLQRQYTLPEGWEAIRDTDGNVTNRPPAISLRLIHTGAQAMQNFSERFINEGLAQGWVNIADGVLILITTEESLKYTILATPGVYCLHCGARLGYDRTGHVGREHVKAQHAGIASPDPAHPAGYRNTLAYECTLHPEQHAKWQRPANATVSHARLAEKA